MLKPIFEMQKGVKISKKTVEENIHYIYTFLHFKRPLLYIIYHITITQFFQLFVH